MTKHLSVPIAAFFGLAILAGCESPAPPTPVVEVEGAIAYDGQSVTSGVIAFVPIDGNVAASHGGAVQNGRYHISPETGLKPGKYRVEIRWAKPTGEKVEAGYGQSPDVYAEAIPAKYHAHSELTAELVEGVNAVDFKLEK